MTKISRRAALNIGLFGAAACSSSPALTPHNAMTPPAGDAFRHGVASGDPMSESVVIWTRISGLAGEQTVSVRWEVAEDAAFAAVVAAGEKLASPAADWTVKTVADGLNPGGAYYYRFQAGAETSPIGRTRTLPEGAVETAQFAVVSCSNYPFGYFNVYDQIARRDDLNAVIHLGDYIYEYGHDGYGGEVGARLGREHDPAHEILTLVDYRRRHAQYKADPSSRAMHAAHPLIMIWDDHETTNNSWKDGAQNHQPETEGDYQERITAALRAYYEWMPVRDPEPGGARAALFRRYDFGDLLTLVALETRLMARSRQLEYSDVVPTLKSAEDIEKFRKDVLGAADREMLGASQLGFVGEAFRGASAAGRPWRVLANQIIMADVVAPNLEPHVTEEDIVKLEQEWDQARAFVEFSKLGLPTNLDAWDGYPAARERLYATLNDAGAEGAIVVTGDTHTWWANDLSTASGAPFGVELGVNSVTSPSPYRREFLGGKGEDYALLTNRENKSVRYLAGDDHGYILLSLTPDEGEARFMAVDTVESAAYNSFEKARFSIGKEDGRAAFKAIKGSRSKKNSCSKEVLRQSSLG